jgi:DNA-binding Xre family transcriptional regulator
MVENLEHGFKKDEVNDMPITISYNKLWKLLIDKKMNKQSLREASGVSTASIAKLVKGENITTDVLLKICAALHCDISDIMEVVPADTESIEKK